MVNELKNITETVNTPLEENEFEVFGRNVGLQLTAMPIQIALKAQQHIQTYLSKVRLQHTVPEQNIYYHPSSTPPPRSYSMSSIISEENIQLTQHSDSMSYTFSDEEYLQSSTQYSDSMNSTFSVGENIQSYIQHSGSNTPS